MRVTHAGLRAEVDDAREFLASRTAPPCPSRSARSSLTKLEASDCLRGGEPRLLQRDVVVLVEIVEPDDLVAALQQQLRACGSR